MSIRDLKLTPAAQQNRITAKDPKPPQEKKSSTFGSIMSGVANVALTAGAAVASFVPGGQGVARSLSSLTGDPAAGGNQDQIDKMWAMQEQNQLFNMQYLQLQQQLQSDNRNFSTMSNLMKVRHDTAKSAINNMHA